MASAVEWRVDVRKEADGRARWGHRVRGELCVRHAGDGLRRGVWPRAGPVHLEGARYQLAATTTTSFNIGGTVGSIVTRI